MWYHNWGLGFGWGWALMGTVMMALFWGAVIWLLVVLAKNLGGRPRPDDDDPKSIADRRLARGEVTLEEHERILARLKG